ncbi:PLP-dependent transferase [Lactarius quietus]|nr:PLP-dependent transferase [Lactarius quietus]
MSLSTLSVPRIIDVASVIQRNLTLDTAKNCVLVYFFARRALKLVRHARARGFIRSFKDIYVFIAQRTLRLVIRLPSVRKKVQTELDATKVDIENQLVPQGKGVVRHLEIPQRGCTLDWILDEMEQMDQEAPSHTDYRDGKLSGAVYHGGDDMEKVLVAAFQRYCVSNPLHPDVFPAVRKMEAEVVAMCLRMYNNPAGAGATTSGGTESILMSVKTHRDWARSVKGISEPEMHVLIRFMVVPASAHAAFDKAAAYFNVTLHSIPVHPETRQVDLKRVRRAMSVSFVVGSAINFPDGCQDDIVGLGRLAKKYNVGLHVDCCLGSFIIPFLEKAGFSSEPFDFRVEGVTAISCDTHKYGFAPKGSSVIMYRSSDLRQYQYYVNPEWAGGVYASPGLAGSRNLGGMHYMGEDGYIASCRDIVGAAKIIERTIQTSFPELYVLGKPPASVVAFGSRMPDLNILEVGDKMSQKGWHLNALQNPPALHIACTRLTVSSVEIFIRDLKEAIWERKEPQLERGLCAIGPHMVGVVVSAFLDALYKA